MYTQDRCTCYLSGWTDVHTAVLYIYSMSEGGVLGTYRHRIVHIGMIHGNMKYNSCNVWVYHISDMRIVPHGPSGSLTVRQRAEGFTMCFS